MFRRLFMYLGVEVLASRTLDVNIRQRPSPALMRISLTDSDTLDRYLAFE